MPAPPEESGTDPIAVRVAGAISDGVKAAVDATNRRLDDIPRTRARRLRRLARDPLPYLFDVHPGARRAIPHPAGVQTIEVAEIAGTAVGPANQRGRDFLPLKAFRSGNWRERWRRVRAASDRLAVLPPIDVQHHNGRYWVVDGHNRVAAALYGGQLDIDANVVELGSHDRPSAHGHGSLAAALEEYPQVQAALDRPTIGAEPGDPAEPAGDGEPSEPAAREPGDPPARRG